jgi:hypothetical protein
MNLGEYKLQDQILPDIQIASETQSKARSMGSISHSAVFQEEMEQEVVSEYWGKFGALPG